MAGSVPISPNSSSCSSRAHSPPTHSWSLSIATLSALTPPPPQPTLTPLDVVVVGGHEVGVVHRLAHRRLHHRPLVHDLVPPLGRERHRLERHLQCSAVQCRRRVVGGAASPYLCAAQACAPHAATATTTPCSRGSHGQPLLPPPRAPSVRPLPPPRTFICRHTPL